jgi:hypothetical protein
VETLGPEKAHLREVAWHPQLETTASGFDELHRARPADPDVQEHVLSEEVVTAISTAAELGCDLS